MSEPTTTQVPPPSEPPPPRRSWRSRLTSRAAVITAGIVALVVVTGVTAALLLPDHDHRRFGPGPGRAGWDEMHEHLRGGGQWGADGPGRFGDRDHAWNDDAGRGPFRMGDDPIVAGTVASVADGSLVVNVDGAGPRALRTDGNTVVFGADNSGLGDLQTGERVVVEVAGTGATATAASVWTPQAQVTGTVTALAGATATVTSVDGLVVTADVAALSQQPTVGDVVVLTGSAVDAGTIRTAGIRVLPRAS
jgi:hypothetical protein